MLTLKQITEVIWTSEVYLFLKKKFKFIFEREIGGGLGRGGEREIEDWKKAP